MINRDLVRINYDMSKCMYKSLVRRCKSVPNAIKLVIGKTNVNKGINTTVMIKDIRKTLINQ